MAAPAKALTDYCCVLAAIQSLKTDKGGRQFTQPQLIDRYPIWTRKGQMHPNGQHTVEGGLGIQEFFHVLQDLGLAGEFRLGIGRLFLESQALSLADGVFLFTMKHQNGQHGGYHCWRVHEWNANNFTVVHSDRNDPAPYLALPWPYLDTFGCTVIVCGPSQVSIWSSLARWWNRHVWP